MFRAKLYRNIGDTVICLLCWNMCKIKEGRKGKCKVRLNVKGELYTTTYGNLSAVDSRPIELKPFFHFKPGSSSLTFSTYSCNLNCPWCQNWHLSKVEPPRNYKLVPPEYLVNLAKARGDLSLCASFNEPTLLFEYLLDCFRIAKNSGLLNTMVSNGYMTPKALKELRNSGLDAINMDIKGTNKVYQDYCAPPSGKSDYVWRSAKTAVKLGIHLEMVNLLVTGVNDDEESIREVINKHLKFVGPQIPLHFTRYYPAYKFTNSPTKISVIERAIEIALKEGVEYVYIGNVPGHRREYTYCPECGEVLVKRYSTEILKNEIKNGRCWKCGREIYGVW